MEVDGVEAPSVVAVEEGADEEDCRVVVSKSIIGLFYKDILIIFKFAQNLHPYIKTHLPFSRYTIKDFVCFGSVMLLGII